MMVLRPADANEATVAWKMALENKTTPTALILSRQGIPDLPAKPGSDSYTDALQAEKGAYVVRDCEGNARCGDAGFRIGSGHPDVRISPVGGKE